MKQTKASILYFMGPAMLLFCLIFIYPVSRTAIMSFFSVKSVTSAASTWSWAGLDNYIKLFHTPLFITSVINIGKIWLYCGIACLGLAIVLAIILTSGLRGQKFFRAIIYMPNVIAAVAVGYMWLLYVYNAKFGLLHSLFTALGWKVHGELPVAWYRPHVPLNVHRLCIQQCGLLHADVHCSY